MNTSYSMETESALQKIFEKNISDGYTHVRTKNKDKLVLHSNKIKEFWNYYLKEVDSKNEQLYIAEKVLNKTTFPSPIIIDFKFTFNIDIDDNEGNFNDLVSENLIRALVYHYQSCITDNVHVSYDDYLTCITMINEDVPIIGDKKYLYIRLQFPLCKIDVTSQEFLKKKYLNILQNDTNIMTQFYSIPNDSLNESMKIPKDYVPMYGSKFDKDTPILKLYKVYLPINDIAYTQDEEYEDIYSIKTNEEFYNIFDKDLHKDKISNLLNNIFLNNKKFDYYLPYFLSINYFNEVSTLIEETLLTKNNNLNIDSENINITLAPFNVISSLLPLLKKERFTYEYYFDCIGKAIKNADPYKSGLELWISYNEIYDSDTCDDLWESFATDEMITYRTIVFYAKKDSYDLYKEWENKIIDKALKLSLSCTHADVSLCIYLISWTDILCTREGNITKLGNVKWYDYDKTHWRICGEEVVIQKINDKLIPRYEKYANKIKENTDDSDPYYKTMCESILKSITELIKKLKTSSFIYGCIKMSIYRFMIRDFNTFYHKDIYLTAFKNCVFEVYIDKDKKKKLTKREGKPEDYLVITTGRIYENIKSESPYIKIYNDFINKIFPDEELRIWFELFCSSLFIGANLDKIFVMFVGKKANNAKSTIVKLLRIMFGQLIINIPPSTCTGKKGKSNESSSELMRMRYARLSLGNEPSTDEELKSGPTKDITGNEPIYGRELFSSSEDVNNQSKVAFVSNKDIPVDIPDRALKNRIKIVPFLSVFENTAPNDPIMQRKSRRYPVDKYIDDKLKFIVKGFQWTIINAFPEYAENGLPTCPIIEKYTDTYWNRNDQYYGFYLNYVGKIENFSHDDENKRYITIYDCYEKFKPYIKYIKSDKVRIPTLQVFVDGMVRFLDEPDEEKWFGYEFIENNKFSKTNSKNQDDNAKNVFKAHSECA